MSTMKISELDSATSIDGTEVLPIVQSGSTKKVTISKLTEDISVDYIVEEGTSSGWTYRKWNSGISECWKNISDTNFSVSTAWGSGLYYGTIPAQTFPTNLFLTNTVPTLTYQCISGTSLICMNSSTATNTSTGAIQVARATAITNAVYTISIRAIGVWK